MKPSQEFMLQTMMRFGLYKRNSKSGSAKGYLSKLNFQNSLLKGPVGITTLADKNRSLEVQNFIDILKRFV